MRRCNELERFAEDLCKDSRLWEILTDEQQKECVKWTMEMMRECGMEVELIYDGGKKGLS